jgi:hypothetical protein
VLIELRLELLLELLDALDRLLVLMLEAELLL